MDSVFGILHVVSTPIGNLADFTFRAKEVLESVDYILSEDTRETKKLLDQYGIDKPQIIYTDQKHTRAYPRILELLQSGHNLALVSDNGTPIISDPGHKLVSELAKAGVVISAVPGANAAISALSVSGLPTDKFAFLGFLPKNKTKRKKILEEYGNLDATLTIYESPYRVKGLFLEISEILGNRQLCVVKDLTKKFETITRATVDELVKEDNIKEKGEYVVLIAKKGYQI